MDRKAPEIKKDDEGNIVIVMHGRLDRRSSGRLWLKAKGMIGAARPRQVRFDFGNATGIDTSGIAVLRLLENFCSNRGIIFSCSNVPPSMDQFIQYAKDLSSEISNLPKRGSEGIAAVTTILERRAQRRRYRKTGGTLFNELIRQSTLWAFIDNFRSVLSLLCVGAVMLLKKVKSKGPNARH